MIPVFGWRTAVTLSAVAVLLAGCTGAPAAPVVHGWRALPVPSFGARILAIEPYGDGLLVLGSVPGRNGRAPGAWTTTDGMSWRPVPVQPHTVYAGQAELVVSGVAGGRVMALGQAFGGAHSNPRLTVWSGDSTGLVEHEQPFEMFGGPHAIAVNDAAALPGTALLAGQWDGPTGRYGAAVWTSPDGATWHRNASDPALASAVGEQTSALGAAAGPAGFLVAGDTLRGALLTPLLWTSSDGVAWRRTSLPAPPVTSQSGGATANRAACDERRCVVAGVALGSPWHALCWPVTGTTAGAGTTGPSGDTMLVSQVALAGGQVYLALRVDNRARLMSTGPDCSGWRDVPLPVGADEVRVGQLSDGLLLATTDATSSELWLRSR